MTNYSRSVLKSNGLRHSKNPPVRFSFSPKTVPVNIAKKLPPQRCFKPLFIASFNFSHKRRNVRFKGLRRVHTRLCSKNRTQRHTRRNRGRFGWGRYYYPQSVFARFGNPARPGVRTAYFAAFGSWPGGALEERRKPSGQRCAYACRCPEASRPRWAA